MKVLCERDRLREGLAVVTSVIPVKSTRPAIENVCLVATDDALELVGTDLEVAVRYKIDEVKVDEPGTALIPARVAADFVRDLNSETVTLSTSGESITIEGGSDQCQLATIDPEEFPVVARFEESGSVPIQAGTFTQLVGRTSFAAARDQGRYAMHGILTLVEDGVVRMVATDGRRLALASQPVDGADGKTKRAIIPVKGMQLFGRVIDDPLEQVRIHFGENQAGLKTAKAEVFARLLDGEFPRYEAVIPSETVNTVEADTEILSRKLKLVANVTNTDTRAIRMSMEKGSMTIFGRSAATGEATAHMEADFKGDECSIAFNPDYLIDGLKACETDRVRFEFNERTSPGKFTLGENFVYIVMPITVDA
jgi:DNA polymerase-3 subunit beta